MPVRTFKVVIAALLGLMALGLPLVTSPAGAELKEMDLAMVEGGGTLTLRDAEEPADLETPTTLTGTVDEFTGAIAGASLAVAPLEFAFDITDPVAATVYVDATFSEVVPGSVTGSVTKVPGSEGLGQVTVDALVKVDLHVEVGSPPIIPASDCTATPIALQLSSVTPYDPTTQRVTLRDANFSVPAVPVTDQCNSIIADGVNERLVGGGHAISVEMAGELFVPAIGIEETVTTLAVAPEGSSDQGDEVTLTSTVAAAPDAEPGTPTGFVEFRDGETEIGSAALDGTGTATFATSDLGVGPHELTALYRGDPTYARSESAAVAHLVAATPTIDISMPTPSVLIGGQPRAATVSVVNPSEFGVAVENGRVAITLARVAQNQAVLTPDRIKVDWLNGDTWEPVTLASAGAGSVAGTIGATTGFALPVGSTNAIKLRISAPTVAGTPSPTACQVGNPTCPGRLLLTAALSEVDPGTGDVVELIGQDTQDISLVESVRRATTFAFTGGVPRPHTVRQGFSMQIFGNTGPVVGGLRASGQAEIYVDGAQTLARPINAPLVDGAYVERLTLANGSVNGHILLPPDIDPGTHFVTVRYLGDAFFAPVDTTTTFTVLGSEGSPFVCREEGFTTKVEVGADVDFDALVPETAASGSTVPLDVSSTVLRMSRPYSGGTVPPWVPFDDGTTTPVGTSPLVGITFELGPDGTGTAASLERQGGTPMPASPNPADASTVDQTITLHDPTASVTVEGDPGDIVPVELTEIRVNSILSELNPVNYTMICTPVGGSLELGEVEIAGTTVTAAPSPAREITDEVTIEADTFPADAAGTVSFSSDLDGALGSDAVDAGEAELVTDELSPGTHVITASFNATDADVPDTTGTATVVVTYSPRSGTEAFVVAARNDFTGSADEDDVLADAEDLDGGLTKAAYLTALSRTDQYLTHVVNEMYIDTLGRPGDEGGVAFWVGRLEAGWPVAKVAASFYSSKEYYDRVGGTDAAWIDDLYDTLLGRPADANGRAYWVSEIPKRGRGLVALAFYQTPESGAFRVADLYEFFLGRAPSTADKAFWTPIVLRRGDLVLAVYLAASDEYADRAEERFPVVS